LQLAGLVPPTPPCVTVAQQFQASAFAARWRRRQLQLVLHPPSESAQDYILHSLIAEHGALFTDPVFPLAATVGAEASRALLRLLAGLEDFARWNAHHPRRKSAPDLAEDTKRRCCLSCLRRLACPLTRAARARFQMHCRVDPVHGDPDVFSLAKLVLRARTCSSLRDGLSRLSVEVVAARQREFRALVPRAS